MMMMMMNDYDDDDDDDDNEKRRLRASRRIEIRGQPEEEPKTSTITFGNQKALSDIIDSLLACSQHARALPSFNSTGLVTTTAQVRRGKNGKIKSKLKYAAIHSMLTTVIAAAIVVVVVLVAVVAAVSWGGVVSMGAIPVVTVVTAEFELLVPPASTHKHALV
uniref:Uncharacterized protein n=1 Tax=Glossina pallidipes TaxID=7398 RepID=A0A1A9Z3N8_GLOPL